MARVVSEKKECPRCGRLLHPLGYARHMAMHLDADELRKDEAITKYYEDRKGGSHNHH